MHITFAHIADCHIGSWKDPRMRTLAEEAFDSAVLTCLEKPVDFVLIAGDLFHTSLPGIDSIKRVVEALKRLKDRHIPVYLIPGSHDYSPSGRTMLDVFEKAGLCVNVAKGHVEGEELALDFTTDEKTGVKIAGILGRRGMLERNYYQDLKRGPLEQEQGFKVFMLHTALEELKPRELSGIEAPPISLLPKNFTYYAAGHVHYVLQKEIPGYGLVVYPGPLFPDNFKEVEQLGHGGFYMVSADTETKEIKAERIPVMVKNTAGLNIDCDGLSPEDIQVRLLEKVRSQEFVNTIVTIRLAGNLSSGRVGDIDFKAIFTELYSRGAHFVMRNTAKLESPEFEETTVKHAAVEEIERGAIAEHAGQIPVWEKDRQRAVTAQMMDSLSPERQEGERVQDYERRLLQAVQLLLGLEDEK